MYKQIKKDETAGLCSRCGEDEMCLLHFVQKSEIRDHVGSCAQMTG